MFRYKDIHFARIFEGEIIYNWTDKSVDEHLFGVVAVDTAGLEVEEEVLVDLAGGCLVADGTGAVPDSYHRNRIGYGSGVEDEPITLDGSD